MKNQPYSNTVIFLFFCLLHDKVIYVGFMSVLCQYIKELSEFKRL